MVSCLLRQSIQRIKAMLLCIEYGILFVDTVDTKIKAHNALNASFVKTVDTRFIQDLKCMSTWSWSCLSNSTQSSIQNGFKASCRHCRYEVHVFPIVQHQYWMKYTKSILNPEWNPSEYVDTVKASYCKCTIEDRERC